MRLSLGFFFVLFITSLCGCATDSNMPLLFGQTHTLGITISSGATSQGGEFTLGYKDADIAVVPVTVKQENGSSTLVKSTVEGSQDAMSVLGQFQVSTATTSNDVGLGTFFATGIAAQQLATGFKHKLEDTATSKDVNQN